MAKENYPDWTVGSLKDELKDRELPTTGNKPDLIKRLVANDRKIARANKKARELAKPVTQEVKDDSGDEPVSILEALKRIGDFLAGEGVTITISSRGAEAAGLGSPAPGTTEDFPTTVGASAVTREQVRDAARQLLAIQPDGRSRALNILGQYGGSVSAVPEEQLEACLSALNQELAAVSS